MIELSDRQINKDAQGLDSQRLIKAVRESQAARVEPIEMDEDFRCRPYEQVNHD